MTIGQRLKQMRTLRNIKQTDLAKMLNVRPSTISYWENDKNEPPIANLKKMTYIFQTRLNEIIGNDTFGADVEISEISNSFLIDFNKLSDERKEKAIATIKALKNEQQYAEMANIKPLPMAHDVIISGVVNASLGEYIEATNAGYTAHVYGKIPDHYDLAVQVNGDSMEPAFQDKQVIFIKQETDVFNGQFIIAEYDNKYYFKRFLETAEGCFLESLNKAYKKMPINDEHPLKIYGIVL